MTNWLQRLWNFLGFGRRDEEEISPSDSYCFGDFTAHFPEILTWLRRERGIPKQKLELTLVDDEEQPVWRIEELAWKVIPELNLLYLATAREPAFQELVQEAFEESGLLIVPVPPGQMEKLPGNLKVNLGEWKYLGQKMTASLQ